MADLAALQASLSQIQQTFAQRLGDFAQESILSVQQTQDATRQNLDVFRNTFNTSLSQSNQALDTIKALNELLSKNVGSAGVKSELFTAPKRLSAFGQSGTFNRQDTIKASTLGSNTMGSRAFGQGRRF